MVGPLWEHNDASKHFIACADICVFRIYNSCEAVLGGDTLWVINLLKS